MYCEIVVKHRKPITATELDGAIRGPFGNDIALPMAYARSAIYAQAPPPGSLFAFETVLNCFVIVRKVNVRFSTYHLEGNNASVSVERMLQGAEEFSNLLISVLQQTGISGRKARSVTVQLFEDNGREAGMQGALITYSSILREKFAWKELKSSIIAFVTALLLIWRGLDQKPWKAALASLVIALVFTFADAVMGCWNSSGKIGWKLRQS